MKPTEQGRRSAGRAVGTRECVLKAASTQAEGAGHLQITRDTVATAVRALLNF